MSRSCALVPSLALRWPATRSRVPPLCYEIVGCVQNREHLADAMPRSSAAISYATVRNGIYRLARATASRPAAAQDEFGNEGVHLIPTRIRCRSTTMSAANVRAHPVDREAPRLLISRPLPSRRIAAPDRPGRHMNGGCNRHSERVQSANGIVRLITTPLPRERREPRKRWTMNKIALIATTALIATHCRRVGRQHRRHDRIARPAASSTAARPARSRGPKA